MRAKKWTALILALIMILGLLSGCSQVEKEFYELVKQVSDLNVYEFNGSMEIAVEQLPKSIFQGENGITEEAVKQICNNNRIEYQGKVDYNQGVMSYDLTLVDKTTGAKTALTSMIFKDNLIYIKVSDLVNYLKKYGSTEKNQKLDRVFGGVDFISISSQDLQSEMNMPPGTPPLWKNNLLKDSKDHYRMYIGLYDTLVYDAYDKYSGNLITKNGNKYVMSFKAADAGSTLKPIAVYSINNIYPIGTAIKAFLEGLSDDDLALLGISKKIKEQSLLGIDLMIDDVNKNHESYLSKINDNMDSINGEIAKYLGDSDIVTTLEKKNGNTYEASTVIHLNVIDSKSSSESLKLTLSTQNTTTTGGDVTVASPDKTITYKELKNKFPVKLTVNIDEKTYNKDEIVSLSKNRDIDVRIIDGSSYLPLRITAELLNYKAGWDNSLEKGYIEFNGQHIYVDGMLIEGKLFVNPREFEQFGFNVSWDDTARTITIERN